MLEQRSGRGLIDSSQLKRVSVEIVKEYGGSGGGGGRMALLCPRCLHLFLLVWVVAFLFIFLLLLYFKDLRGFIPSLDGDVDLWEDEAKEYSTMEYYEEEIQTSNVQQLEMKLNKSLADLLAANIMTATNGVKKLLYPERCPPEQNIVFIKTHKTASSTVTNILNRFADLGELMVALPAMGDIRFSWPRKFHWSNVDLLRLDGRPANILVNHARYHRHEMNLIMEEKSKYITILRHPVSQFESSFYYFEFDKLLGLRNVSNPIEVFLHHPDEYLYNLTLLLGDLPEPMNLIQSGMVYDLGYDFMDLEPDDSIKKFLRKLDQEFTLVLVMEYFDESLVLMKREFCWQLDDILYIKQNQRLKHITVVSSATRSKIEEWNHADVMLYEYFNNTLWRKIAQQGTSFWDEVREFRALNRQFKRTCSPQKVTTKGFKINVDVSGFVMNPKVDRLNRYLCEKVLMTEVDYLSYFRKKFGVNFGYQKILVAEGLRPLNSTNVLSQRMKKYARVKRHKRVKKKGGWGKSALNGKTTLRGS